MSQNHLPFNKRRLLPLPDPNGFTLREHPRNLAVVRAAARHVDACGENTSFDLMDDTPEGDVCCGLACTGCDWERLFPFDGFTKTNPKARAVRS